MKNIKPVSSILFILSALILFLVFSCEKEKMPVVQPVYSFETDSLIDVDGNSYKTVKIGDQWWMSENLKVTHYRNNSVIFNDPNISNSDWSNLSKGIYCNDYFGKLYNWYAIADTNGLAPAGWRIPTDEDWKKLETYLGMSADDLNMSGWRGSHEGEKLKSRKFGDIGSNWTIDQNIRNTNESGFSAFSGNCRLKNGSFGDRGPGDIGFWWTSSENGNEEAWYRSMDYRYGGIFRYYGPKQCAFSVRCIKIETSK